MDACDSGLTLSRWFAFRGESIYRPVKYEPGVVKQPGQKLPCSLVSTQSWTAMPAGRKASSVQEDILSCYEASYVKLTTKIMT